MTSNKPSKDQAVHIEPAKNPERYKEPTEEQRRKEELEDRISENKARRESRNG